MKDYLKKKDSEKLSISLTEQKLAKSLARAPHSFSEDGKLHFGFSVMLFNAKTNGNLSIDVGDKIPSLEEAYAVTVNSKGLGPLSRSTFIICRMDDKETAPDDLVHYGQKIRIQANPNIFHKPLYMKSCPISPQAYARFSRFQEVSMYTKATFDTVWSIEHADPNERYKTIGMPVEVNEPVIVLHCGTAHYLSSDLIEYR